MVASVMKLRITLPSNSGINFFDDKLDADDNGKGIRKPLLQNGTVQDPPLIITPPLYLSISFSVIEFFLTGLLDHPNF